MVSLISYCSFGTLVTATLVWEGIPAYLIGIARGVSATIGIAATFLYPTFQARISTLRMGLVDLVSGINFIQLNMDSFLLSIVAIAVSLDLLLSVILGYLCDFKSVDQPLSVCSFNMGAKQPYNSICADGWSRFITAWTMDV